jgi:hypothetical protein
MFFNYDSMPLVVTTAIIGGLFSYSIYSIFTTSTNTVISQTVVGQAESLVNTVQPNIDSISELPETIYPCIQPNVLPDNLHVDVGVQTSTKSLYTMFKEWLRELFSIHSSDIGSTPTEVRVENWIGHLDSTQLVSTNDINSVVSNNQLPNLVNIGDSVSNIGEIVSPLSTFKVYDFGAHNVELFNQLSVVASNQITGATINGSTHYVVTVNNIMLTVDPYLIVMNPLFV